MKAERVAELTFGRESAGSGYFITSRHVLTARHVVKPTLTGIRCKVQPLLAAGSGDLPLNRQSRPPPLDGVAKWMSDRHDLAVVELMGPPLIGLPVEPVPCGYIPSDDLFSRPCRGAGFPAAARNDDKVVEGTLTYVSRGQYLNLTLDRALPRDYRKWAGLSGAVMFCGDLAVGVVETVDSEWEGLLTATPTQHLLEDESFKDYLETQRLPMPPMYKVNRFDPKGIHDSLLSKISDHVYLINRKDPIDRIKKHMKGAPSESAPQIIAIVGLDDDEHPYLIRQLAENREIQELLKRDAGNVDVIIPLPWPGEVGEIDPDPHFHMLLKAVCSAANVAVPLPSQPPPVAELRASFNDSITSRAFCVFIRRKIAISGHGRLFQKLLDFWRQIGDGLPIFLLLCLAWDDPSDSQVSHPLHFWFSKPETDNELDLNLETARREQRLLPVGPLREIRMEHVGPWIDEVRACCASVKSTHLEGLRLAMLHRVGSGKRARQVAADLGNLLQLF